MRNGRLLSQNPNDINLKSVAFSCLYGVNTDAQFLMKAFIGLLWLFQEHRPIRLSGPRLCQVQNNFNSLKNLPFNDRIKCTGLLLS
jgi:hypothetical protein